MEKASSKRGRQEENGGEGKDARQRTKAHAQPCPRMQLCRDYVCSLNLEVAYFNPACDRCFCVTCASAARIPDILEQHNQHGHPYEVPKGWCGFGLDVPRRAHTLEVFDKWAVAFHGCPGTALASILDEGQLMTPGATLLDGTTLPNRLTRGGDDRIGLYTSPSIKYAELDIYTQPSEWQGHTVRIVLQCRQKMDIRPPQLRIERETIGWQGRFGKAAISQHFPNAEIERVTTAQNSIIPYRVLVSMDIQTREEEDEAKKNVRNVQAAALNARQATTAFEASEEKIKIAQANLAALVQAEKEHKAALAKVQKEKKTAQNEANAAVAGKRHVATAQSAAQDGLVRALCTFVTDQNILRTLQPSIQALIFNQVTQLNFHGWRIDWKTRAGLEGVAALAAAVASSRSLTTANLRGCGMSAKGLAVLATQGVAKSSSLSLLDLSCNKDMLKGEEGRVACTALAQALASCSSLRKLNLRECNMSTEVFVVLATQGVAKSPLLSCLDLSCNEDMLKCGVGQAASTALAKALAVCSSLQKLHLDGAWRGRRGGVGGS